MESTKITKQENFKILNEIKITYKRKFKHYGKIRSSLDAYNLALEVLGDGIEYKEYFYLIALNNANEVLGVKKISEGGITATLVDVRIVFQTLLKAHAVGYIVFHNHPSGTLIASQSDKLLTKKLQKAGETLEIKMLDHLIATPKAYFSFADENLL